MLDYLVVGLGLAGISFCETLEQNGRSFRVVTDDSQKASTVAGGLYNPVILKRFTLSWKAHEQLPLLRPFYTGLEEKLGVPLDFPLRVLRRFASTEEQNGWFEASDRPGLGPLLSTDLIKNTNPVIDAPFGYGEVLDTGRLDTELLQQAYRKYLTRRNLLVAETFDFDALVFTDAGVAYKGVEARQIVFAMGFGLKQDPFFNYLPLNGTKGELLTIRAPELKESRVIKSAVFIIPLGEDLYRIGATYKWQDKTHLPTREAREELETKLRTFLRCEYEVVDHVAGVRPTVADRRPLLGRHPVHKDLYVLNGFGSRGVMIAPFASKVLCQFIEEGKELPSEMDISRFRKRFGKQNPS
ncbi:Glycine/D-amino acid oxidase [Muriicola jejuensis]|uniref:FAD-dependent oxidoreductase n=1 Tax=Muriicola jejuensis TaxID=504488 RepID=A0A6P0UN07_9FLAO|nr:FAD-dependent oxidoreductase [Muriicola jejuensis]NER11676.1 FAD-dependent oxidoreductase [Muriicola jejuensis]SMP25494.1 Glycine/D-amino acid oxidase [Muriicola jejuensis]